jgi:hypothetical protein
VTTKPSIRIGVCGINPASIDRSLPFAVLKATSHVNQRAKAANDDPRFSVRIRDGVPRMVPGHGPAGVTQ